MFARNAQEGHARRAWLSLVMLGVLLLMVSAAWLLVRARSVPPAGAEDVLRALREKGLRHYWPRPRERWLLLRKDGAPVGWNAAVVLPAGNGEFRGLDVTYDASSRAIVWEAWRLNADATAGDYAAGRANGRGRSLTTDTRIRYAAGRLETVQFIDGQRYASGAEAPGNYLPEGTVPLARRIVADRESSARFQMVIHSAPPQGDRTRLVTLTIAYAGTTPRGPLEGARQVHVSLGRTDSGVYLLDEDGDLLGAEDGGLSMTAATAAEVSQQYGNAARLVRALLGLSLDELGEAGDSVPLPPLTREPDAPAEADRQ